MVRENTRGKAIQSARSLRPESFDGGEFDAVAVALGPIGEAVDIVGFDAVGGADLEREEGIDVVSPSGVARPRPPPVSDLFCLMETTS
jgi:hypothetical protein